MPRFFKNITFYLLIGKNYHETYFLYKLILKLKKNVIFFYLPLKRQTKIAADDILFFYFNLSKKIRLDCSCESFA